MKRKTSESMFSKIDNFITPDMAVKLFYALIIFILLLGIKNSFIQDDAFISFRYAENLVAGHGLTWNIGDQEKIEGYTNFLWVMVIAFVMVLGIDPVLGSMFIGMCFAVGTLFFTYKLSLMILKSRSAGLLTVILLGTNYSFSSYMTGGLETQLQTFLLVASAYSTFYLVNGKELLGTLRLASLSVLFSLAIMTRLDSALICSILYFFILFEISKKEITVKEKVRLSIPLTIPGLLLVGIWLLFKIIYYGDILPNTYYVKASGFSIESIINGAWYVWSFIYNYFLTIFLFLGYLYARKIFTQTNMFVSLIILSLWSIYVIKVGGDFMEYRFLVPVLPFIFVLISNCIFLVKYPAAQAVLIMLVLSGSYYHALTYEGGRGGDPIYQLNAYIEDQQFDWDRVGVVLGKLFSGSNEPVRIAVTAAGAIPYYSKLPTVDMLGLNDKWIAKNGVKLSTFPGHTRYSTLKYLVERNVNIVVGHPKVKPISAPFIENPRKFFWAPIEIDLLPEETKVIEIPLNARYKIQVLYLRQHDLIDERIGKLNLVTYKVSR